MDVGVAWEVKQDIEQALVAHCAAYPQVGEGETGCKTGAQGGKMCPQSRMVG